MAGALFNGSTDCCTPDCPDTTNISIPGPKGDTGIAGTNGIAGKNSFTTLTSAFVQPAINATVPIAVADSSWMGIGQFIFIVAGGFYTVVSKASLTSITVKNIGYSVNAVAGVSVPSASLVSPAGIKGTDGAAGSPANSPLTTKADLWTRDATSDVRLAVGTDGQRVVADSAQAAGMRYDKVDLSLSAEVKNALAIANGGTGATTAVPAFNALSPVTTRGDMIYRDATNNVRLLLGAQYKVVQSNGTDPIYDFIGANNLSTALSVVGVDIALFREEQVSGTDGGAFNSGAWRTRTLNVETFDTGNYGSLAANQITLAAGTYRFRAVAVAYEVDSHQCRLFNITSGSAIAVGTSSRAAAAVDVATVSECGGRFTIAGNTVFELQHQCGTTKAASGFGKAANLGVNEVFSFIEFVREAR